MKLPVPRDQRKAYVKAMRRTTYIAFRDFQRACDRFGRASVKLAAAMVFRREEGA